MTQNNDDLKLSSYDYELPESLIAQRPEQRRDLSKLLVYNEDDSQLIHEVFHNCLKHIPSGSTLILNQSKVFPCRLQGKKSSGGKCEVFILRPMLDEFKQTQALIKTSGKKRVGDSYIFADVQASIVEIDQENAIFTLKFELAASEYKSFTDFLQQAAQIPIPPYIRKGLSDEQDKINYQTVYCADKDLGSVAAPTAGLHFTPELLQEIKNKGVEIAYVTLHVGLGTFLPVKSEYIKEHFMHEERFYIDDKNLAKIMNAKSRIAVGTTSLRVLETIHKQDYQIKPNHNYSTSIFLYPGIDVKSIDGIFTNFHLPKSSLLMLVSALIGRQNVLDIYKEAIDKKYRFFSYGDSMFIKRKSLKQGS